MADQVTKLEKQVKELKAERQILIDGYERKLRQLQEKLDKVLAMSIIEDAKTTLRDAFSLPEIPKTLTQDFTIDDNTEVSIHTYILYTYFIRCLFYLFSQ